MTELEKEIDLLEEVRDNCYTQAQDYEDAFLFEKANILDNAIERLKRCGWIPCSERIPEKYRFVLVCRKRGGWFIADWDGKNWHTDGYLEIEGNGIAAWMPLPKLWKDET